MFEVNGKRASRDLKDLRAIGAYKTGVHRPTFSQDDMRARHWLLEQLTAAGLDAQIDGIGNVFGRTPGARKAILAGSHIESQPEAGWLDGALGVVFALEVARSAMEAGNVDGLGIDVAAWADEEGYFGHYLGSRSFCGELDDETLRQARSRDNGEPLQVALARAGLAGRPRIQCEPGRYLGYFEAHIEQGPVLESADLRIAVVTDIIGSRQYRIEFIGKQNHAGTTPMSMRADAGQAMCNFRVRIDEKLQQLASNRSVWTVSRLTVEPGVQSVIPGRAEMLVQFRDTDIGVLTRFEHAISSLADEMSATGPCSIHVCLTSESAPALMEPAFQNALQAAADRIVPGRSCCMHSGAGHDAQILALKMPAAMMFVPSIGGVSHHWSEDTKDEDIVMGCRVFGDAIAAVMAGNLTHAMRQTAAGRGAAGLLHSS